MPATSLVPLNLAASPLRIWGDDQYRDVNDLFQAVQLIAYRGILQVITVTDFGVDNTGTVDSSVALQTIINSVSGNTMLFFPPGRYVFAGVNVNKSGLYFLGSGYGTQFINPTVGTNTFTVTGQFVSMSNMFFGASVVRVGGWYVDVTNGHRFRIQEFWIDGGSQGIRLTNVSTGRIITGDILSLNAGTGLAIRIDGGFATQIVDVLTDGPANTFAAIYISSCGDVIISKCNLITSGNCVTIAPGAGQVAASVWIIDSFLDTSVRGVLVNPAAGGAVVRMRMTNVWTSSHTNHGVLFAPAVGASVQGCNIEAHHGFLNGLDAISINGACTGIRVTDSICCGNNGAGVSVGANVTKFHIADNFLSDGYGVGPNLYGVFIGAGASDFFEVTDNDLSGNTIAAMANAATGIDGYVGQNLGLPSFTVPVAVGASPFAYTAGYRKETVYIDAGIVGIINYDGVNIFTSTDKTVRLEPKKTVTITYAVAPTMASTTEF